MHARTIAALAAIAAIAIGGCEANSDSTDHSNDKAPNAQVKADNKPAKDNKPDETVAQENARQTADSYLDMSGFSRSGLIDQLMFEGYSKKLATYGVDSLNADWKVQAARTAQSYLDTSSFSRAGLIEQLKYEGYTTSQATYGVTQAGL